VGIRFKSAKRRIRVYGNLVGWTALLLGQSSLPPDLFSQITLGSAAVFALLLSILDVCQRDVTKDVCHDCTLSVAAGKLFSARNGKSSEKDEADIAAIMFQILSRDAAVKRIVLERSDWDTGRTTIAMSRSNPQSDRVRKRKRRSQRTSSKVNRKPSKLCDALT
jgi:hypothetical protein